MAKAERISRCSFTFDGKGAKAGGIARLTIFVWGQWQLDHVLGVPRHTAITRPDVWQMFEAERPSLVAYAGRFDGVHAVPATAAASGTKAWCAVGMVHRSRTGPARGLKRSPQACWRCRPSAGHETTACDFESGS
jgi:hypothetical protein